MLALYLSLSFIFFIYVAEPALNGVIDLRVSADAPSYEAVADSYSDVSDLVTGVGNFLGPVMIIKLLNNNYYYIYLLNCLIFVVSYYLLSKVVNINSSKLLFYLVINPILFISLMSVNKEILSFLFFALFVVYLKNKNMLFLLLCFFSSFIARWQLTLVLLAYLALTSSFLKLNMNRFKALFVFVLVISAAYIVIYPEVQVFDDTANLFADSDTQGSGLFIVLNEIQAKYGYFIVVIPKIIQNLFGGVIRISIMFDWSDFYNNFIVLLQCIYLSALALLLLIKKKVDLYNDILYLAAVYCIIFAVSPIVQARYFFIVSVMFSFLLSDEREIYKTHFFDMIKSPGCRPREYQERPQTI